MPTITRRRTSRMLFTVILVLSAGCRNHETGQPPDHPRLTPNLTLQDVTFRSSALNRDMQYRVVWPRNVAPRRKLQVVYLLHGGGGGFRDWTNYSYVARFAESGFVLEMPEGGASYYTNAGFPRDFKVLVNTCRRRIVTGMTLVGAAENSCRRRGPSAAKAAIDFVRITARLEAAPLQNFGQMGFS